MKKSLIFSLEPFPLRTSQSPIFGKTPLRPLGRPQDRSGSPTKGAKLTGGNLPDCRLRADSPFPCLKEQFWVARLLVVCQPNP
ncbi:MAG: hypothetical protein ACHBN1_25000 [Heteroscytonema crispum UTEX LB 1556]